VEFARLSRESECAVVEICFIFVESKHGGKGPYPEEHKDQHVAVVGLSCKKHDWSSTHKIIIMFPPITELGIIGCKVLSVRKE